MQPVHNAPLAPLTSLQVGGPAGLLYTCRTTDEIRAALAAVSDGPLWVLGYGANVLISDAGLPGVTVLLRTSAIAREENVLVAEAGVWWDNLVRFAIRERLWGLELMSAIPGGVGAAVVGNIAAYGQAVADTLQWVDVLDTTTGEQRRVNAGALDLTYRRSAFQTAGFQNLIILRAAFGLVPEPQKTVEYQAALDVARELGSDLGTLDGRRATVLETRRRAGSLWDYRRPGGFQHTAGSFFRNPLVDAQTAERLMAMDETGRTADSLRLMNRVHGGAQQRVSAAHVLLAAGFQRGQTWGPVRLHPDHILKLENTGGATARQIYDVAQEILSTVRERLDITLEPEVRFLGEF